MNFKYDVFLSHSSHDDVFARSLARMLEAARTRVWIDDEDSGLGKVTEEMLEEAMQASRRAVFVVTPNWSKGRWTKWEAEHFADLCQRDGPRRGLIPIFRGIDRSPYFAGLTHLKWPPEADADKMFWRLWCGLQDEEPGAEEEWAEKGRRLRGLGPTRGPVLEPQTPAEIEAKALMQIQWGGGQDALSCDREKQWGLLTAKLPDLRHEAFFVTGGERQGHLLFLKRIEECLQHPQSLVRTVEWEVGVAWTLGRFRAALAKAVEARANTDKGLEEALAARLKTHNLVLLHRPVCTWEVREKVFADYYTEFLPERIAGASGQVAGRVGAVKVVQAVAWSQALAAGRPLALLLRRLNFRGAWIDRALEQADAAAAIEEICSKADERGLKVIRLPDLDREQIEERHVREVSESLAKEKREIFVKEVMSKAGDPLRMFAVMTKWFASEEEKK